MTNYEELVYRMIGANIKKCREDAGLKQEELANDIGVSRPSIANYESGKQAIYISDLYLISKRLQVGITELLPREEEVQELLSVQAQVKKDPDLTENEREAIEDFVKHAENKEGGA
jgi:transcriptional regulator with XRE-family HTH domain